MAIDKATIKNTCTAGVDDICTRYEGNDDGDEPTEIGSGNDGGCRFPSPLSVLLTTVVC